MSWRVARSLDVLLDEINTLAPNRSKLTDGSIGDAAHASRSSDHNPWVTDSRGVGVVRARDFTHDPAHGCDAGELAEHVRQLGARGAHPALGPGAYVIWNHRIASDTYGWEWRPYSGSNPHTQHCHVSVATAAAGYDSTTRWGITNQEDIMATKAELAELLDSKLQPVLRDLAALKTRLAANGAIRGRLKAIAKQDRIEGRELAELRELVEQLAEDEGPKGRG